MAYDVDENKEVFFKEVEDGVEAVMIGRIGGSEHPLALVGGNCTIQGFDHTGEDAYWTVTGDNVSAMSLCDVDQDGQHELLVASEDFEIRIFQDEEVISEHAETGRVLALAPLVRTLYGYGLEDGTVGVYDRDVRKWRIKTAAKPTALMGFDLDGDGVPELISGWSNGTFDVRDPESGRVLFTDALGSGLAPVASLLNADYRNDGGVQVIVASGDGEVRGYAPLEGADAEPGVSMLENAASRQEQDLAELRAAREELVAQLKTVEENMKSLGGGSLSSKVGAMLGTSQSSSGPMDGASRSPRISDAGVRKALMSARLSARVGFSSDMKGTLLRISTNSPSMLKVHMAVVEAERLFPDGRASDVAFCKIPEAELVIPINPGKVTATTLHVTASISAEHSTGMPMSVLKMTVPWPKFATFARRVGNVAHTDKPPGVAHFELPVSRQRVIDWIRHSFLISTDEMELDAGNAPVVANLEPMENSPPPLTSAIRLVFTPNSTGEAGSMEVGASSLEVASELISDLLSFLKVESDVTPVLDFPGELERVGNALGVVAELYATRSKLSAEVADNSGLIKSYVVGAEDARMMNDMKGVREAYGALWRTNSELRGEHAKRAANHKALVEALREVNSAITHASACRLGSARTGLVAAARGAVKSGNKEGLRNVLKHGAA